LSERMSGNKWAKARLRSDSHLRRPMSRS
jgi:hypothetical protein